MLKLLLILSLHLECVAADDVVSISCQRIPNLPYCETKNKVEMRRFEENKKDSIALNKNSKDTEDLFASPLPYVRYQNRLRFRNPTLSYSSYPKAIYAVYPSLLPKDNPRWYCDQSQFQFQTTCVPWKKLRFDLKIFCQEYADICAVPNDNEYPSGDDGRPYGHGQKQTDGAIGVGSSYGLGLGPVPGFEVVGSQGVDVGPVPGLDEIGGFVVNRGTDIGILGERIGPGPARIMNGLEHGYPTLNPSSPSDQRATADLQQNLFRSLGLGNLPGLGRLFGKSSSREPRKPKVRGYEPGYGAVNKKAPISTGKTDTDGLTLPVMIGDLELSRGIGLGIG